MATPKFQVWQWIRPSKLLKKCKKDTVFVITLVLFVAKLTPISSLRKFASDLHNAGAVISKIEFDLRIQDCLNLKEKSKWKCTFWKVVYFDTFEVEWEQNMILWRISGFQNCKNVHFCNFSGLKLQFGDAKISGWVKNYTLSRKLLKM